MDKNKVIILPRGQSPILGTRNFYFTDRKLAKAAFSPLPVTKSLAVPAHPKPALSAPKPKSTTYNSGSQIASSTIERGAIFAKKAALMPPVNITKQEIKLPSVDASNKATSTPFQVQDTLKLGEITNVFPKHKFPPRSKKPEPIRSAQKPTANTLSLDFAAMAAKSKVSNVDEDKAMRLADLFMTGEKLGQNSKDKAVYNEKRSIIENEVIKVMSE
jgi:hypothetical protein